jgi:putative toxin-antitoxin system antitoxin component (TIGR02293 family)
MSWRKKGMPSMPAITATTLNKYIGEWLGAEPSSEHDLVLLAENGLPLVTVRRMTEHGLSKREVYELIVPERTLKHRKSRRQKLSREESDRAIRTARLLARAQAVFGDADRALRWMREPKRRFNARSPLQMMGTEAGGRLVEGMLVQVDEGMFA